MLNFDNFVNKINIFVTTAGFRHFVSFSSKKKRNPLEPKYNDGVLLFSTWMR